MINPNVVQVGYRFRNDNGSEAAATWRQNQNTADTIDADTTFRLRLEAHENAGAARSVGGQLEVALNGGAFQSVTTTSTVVKAVIGGVADGTATTNILTAGAGGFVAGSISNDGLAAAVSLTSQHTEIEYTLQIVGTDVTNGDTITFRIAGLNSYTVTASATASVPTGPGSYFFDGTDDKIQYPDVAALDALNLSRYLVVAWVRPGTGGNSNARICGRTDNAAGTSGHMQLMIGDGTDGTRSGNFSGRQKHTGTAETRASATGIVPNEAWSLVGQQFDAAAAAGSRIRLFEQGAPVTAANTASGVGTQDLAVNDPFVIGNEQSGARPYQGHIAYLFIYNVSTLSDTQVNTLVSDLYAGGSGSGVTVPQQSLLVELVRLSASGQTSGDKSVLGSPTITGAAFASGQSPPVTYDALSGGSTHVTTTWQSSYVAKDHVTATWGSSYVCKTHQQAAWASSYTVRDHVTGTWQSAYTVNDHATATWQSSYTTKAHATGSWGSSYTTRAHATASWGSSYTVHDHATAVWASGFVVRDHATTTWESSYDVEVVGSSHQQTGWQSSYTVKAHATAAWGSSYTVHDHVTAGWASSYTTHAHVATSWASSYTAKAHEATSWATSYTAKARVATSWGSSYDVEVTGSSHEQATWQSSYTTRAHVTAGWASSYVCEAHRSASWASSWVTRAKATASWQSSYTVKARLNVNWGSGYGVAEHALAEWASSYTAKAHITRTWASSCITRERLAGTWQSSYTVDHRGSGAWASSYSVTGHLTFTWPASYTVAQGGSVPPRSTFATPARSTGAVPPRSTAAVPPRGA